MAGLHELVALFNQGRLAEAEALGRALVDSQPRPVEALKILGSIKIKQRAPAEARQYFERIAALEPRSAEALSNLAWVLLQIGDADEALALCDRALALSPDAAGAWVARGARCSGSAGSTMRWRATTRRWRFPAPAPMR
jgi:tetratricopeptide (TPR) repeat protein